MVKNPVANAEDIRDAGSISGLERSPEGGHGNHSSILASEAYGQRSLAGYSPHGCRESDTTEVTEQACTQGDRLNRILDFQCPNWTDKLITRTDI